MAAVNHAWAYPQHASMTCRASMVFPLYLHLYLNMPLAMPPYPIKLHYHLPVTLPLSVLELIDRRQRLSHSLRKPGDLWEEMGTGYQFWKKENRTGGVISKNELRMDGFSSICAMLCMYTPKLSLWFYPKEDLLEMDYHCYCCKDFDFGQLDFYRLSVKHDVKDQPSIITSRAAHSFLPKLHKTLFRYRYDTAGSLFVKYKQQPLFLTGHMTHDTTFKQYNNTYFVL